MTVRLQMCKQMAWCNWGMLQKTLCMPSAPMLLLLTKLETEHHLPVLSCLVEESVLSRSIAHCACIYMHFVAARHLS